MSNEPLAFFLLGFGMVFSIVGFFLGIFSIFHLDYQFLLFCWIIFLIGEISLAISILLNLRRIEMEEDPNGYY